MADLKVTYRQVSELIPYANNARTHSDEQVAQIATGKRSAFSLKPLPQGG